MMNRYLLLGAGRQGIAAAYDLGKFGDAAEIVVSDINGEAANAGARKLNDLLERRVARPLCLDIGDTTAVRTALDGMTACISSVHYGYNLGLTEVAISARVHMTDLGGNTAIVRQQLELDPKARAAGVGIVPDCGMGPGLNISLAAYVMELLDVPREVRIWDGGLPQDPKEPWNYALTFNIAGLTNEYDGCAMFIRDGKVTPVPCFSDVEEIAFNGLGPLEAFVTSGGLSTAPWTFEQRLQRLENKTVRYRGHAAAFKAFSDLGLLEQEPVKVGDVEVTPREMFHTLLEPRITDRDVRDVCVMRVRGDGEKGGRPATAIVELIDRYDPVTGFSAMQRLTGWHASIMLIAAVSGRVGAGVVPVERALSGAAVVTEALRRGFDIRTNVAVQASMTRC
jgi:lysine 6-dehydrogenase